MNRSFIFSSNSERLSWRDWIIVVVIFVVIFNFFPLFWSALEKFNPPPDYRFPYQLSDDYWMLTRWNKYACLNFPALIIGDSFIWGHYVTMEQTLSHYLNELVGENIFANMGVDGLHPAAIAGLLKYYGKDMKLEDLIQNFTPRQREFLISVAMKPQKSKSIAVADVRKDTLSIWKRSDGFNAALYQVLEQDFADEALFLYFGDNIDAYAKSIHDMAVGAKTDKTKLEAAKFALSLARGEKKEEAHGSLMEKYMEDNKTKK